MCVYVRDVIREAYCLFKIHWFTNWLDCHYPTMVRLDITEWWCAVFVWFMCKWVSTRQSICIYYRFEVVIVIYKSHQILQIMTCSDWNFHFVINSCAVHTYIQIHRTDTAASDYELFIFCSVIVAFKKMRVNKSFSSNCMFKCEHCFLFVALWMQKQSKKKKKMKIKIHSKHTYFFVCVFTMYSSVICNLTTCVHGQIRQWKYNMNLATGANCNKCICYKLCHSVAYSNVNHRILTATRT